MFELAIVVAVADNGAIGRNNELPWHLPGDLKYFKNLTMGHPVIMGRKTYESIGRPLPGRTSVVVTGQKNWFPGEVGSEVVLIAHSFEEAVMLARQTEQGMARQAAMIIGGAKIYEQALPICHKIFLTEVHANIDADAFFPSLKREEFTELSRQNIAADEKNPYKFSLVELKRSSEN